MQIKRINENTLSCILSPEDLRANGFQIDDFFERKKEAVDFIRATVTQAAISENFDLTGELTTMRVSILPDHSLSLLITRETTREGAAKEVRRLAQSLFETIAARAMEKAKAESGQTEEEEDSSADSLMKALLSDSAGRTGDGDAESDGDGGSAAVSSADTYMFSFYTMRDAMNCGKIFAQAGPLESSLYYLAEDDTYFLLVHRTAQTPAGFEKLVLSANEFGELITSREQFISYVTEHGICIAKKHAVEMFMDVMPGLKVPKIRRAGKRHSSSAGASGRSTAKASGDASAFSGESPSEAAAAESDPAADSAAEASAAKSDPAAGSAAEAAAAESDPAADSAAEASPAESDPAADSAAEASAAKSDPAADSAAEASPAESASDGGEGEGSPSADTEA